MEEPISTIEELKNKTKLLKKETDNKKKQRLLMQILKPFGYLADVAVDGTGFVVIPGLTIFGLIKLSSIIGLLTIPLGIIGVPIILYSDYYVLVEFFDIFPMYGSDIKFTTDKLKAEIKRNKLAYDRLQTIIPEIEKIMYGDSRSYGKLVELVNEANELLESTKENVYFPKNKKEKPTQTEEDAMVKEMQEEITTQELVAEDEEEINVDYPEYEDTITNGIGQGAAVQIANPKTKGLKQKGSNYYEKRR